MATDVVVICPELSPGSGGVGDYTLRIVEEWHGIRPRFLVANLHDEATGHRAERLDTSARAVRELSADANVLLQYSAYGFHPFGYPLALLRALGDWKRSSQGTLVVMFHEIWTFWPAFNKNYPLQWLHRRDLGQLVRIADEVFTSTAGQAEHLRKASGGANVKVLPVGSNIRPSTAAEHSRQPGRAVLFGLQASRVRTLQQIQGDLRALAARGAITELITIGGGNNAEGDREERALLDQLQLSGGADMRGMLVEQEVSDLLCRASFAISAQDELSVTKSGTFVAYAAHGLNIISPHAGGASAEPLCWATSPRDLLEGISTSELTTRAQKLRDWYERTCSWPRIAEEFARALQLRPLTQ